MNKHQGKTHNTWETSISKLNFVFRRQLSIQTPRLKSCQTWFDQISPLIIWTVCCWCPTRLRRCSDCPWTSHVCWIARRCSVTNEKARRTPCDDVNRKCKHVFIEPISSFYFSTYREKTPFKVMQTWSLVSICVLLGVAVRWGVSLNSYSGRKRVHGSNCSKSRHTVFWGSTSWTAPNWCTDPPLPIQQTNSWLCVSRSRKTSHVWRLWSAETLAGSHVQLANAPVVSVSIPLPEKQLTSASISVCMVIHLGWYQIIREIIFIDN